MKQILTLDVGFQRICKKDYSGNLRIVSVANLYEFLGSSLKEYNKPHKPRFSVHRQCLLRASTTEQCLLLDPWVFIVSGSKLDDPNDDELGWFSLVNFCIAIMQYIYLSICLYTYIYIYTPRTQIIGTRLFWLEKLGPCFGEPRPSKIEVIGTSRYIYVYVQVYIFTHTHISFNINPRTQWNGTQ